MVVHMNIEIKLQVEAFLKAYPERERQISLLRYEMRHIAHITPEEMITEMSLGHGGSSCRNGKGHISNKTMYIALNYQEQMEKINTESMNEIAERLLKLEREQDRIRYYVSLLVRREAEVIRLFYFEEMTMENVEEKMCLSAKTVRKLKNQAVESLAEMYEFAANRK